MNEPALYATTFGYSGTDWDYVLELARERGGLRGLINLEVCEAEVSSILAKAGFTYRFGGVLEWILKTMEMVRSLS
ncbi:MAG: hypothetical protein LBU32_29495 [Clostridiales bacterium]|nr:hypothetical protein [Clostridiales bacterium]